MKMYMFFLFFIYHYYCSKIYCADCRREDINFPPFLIEKTKKIREKMCYLNTNTIFIRRYFQSYLLKFQHKSFIPLFMKYADVRPCFIVSLFRTIKMLGMPCCQVRRI